MQGATAACLNYRVMLPEDFEFAEGGMLPGLYGGERVNPGSVDETKTGFATRIMWGPGGVLELGSLVTTGQSKDRRSDESQYKLETGQLGADLE